MSVFEKFEVVKTEPYRFVGRAVFIGNKGPNNKWLFDIHNFLWNHCDWVFKKLDNMTEYASDEPHNAVLFTWDKYGDSHELYGYYVGRFMKADTPVPSGMDYRDITEEYLAKAFRKGKHGDVFGDMLIYAEGECKNEIGKTEIYKQSDNFLMAEMYPEPDENGESYIGTYIPCEKSK